MTTEHDQASRAQVAPVMVTVSTPLTVFTRTGASDPGPGRASGSSSSARDQQSSRPTTRHDPSQWATSPSWARTPRARVSQKAR